MADFSKPSGLEADLLRLVIRVQRPDAPTDDLALLADGIRLLGEMARDLAASEQAATAALKHVHAAGTTELEQLRGERDAFADRVDTLTAVARSNRQAQQTAAAEAERMRVVLDRTDKALRQCIANARAGGAAPLIHASQVLALLSPTWPDGNYEAAPPDAPAASDAEQWRWSCLVCDTGSRERFATEDEARAAYNAHTCRL